MIKDASKNFRRIEELWDPESSEKFGGFNCNINVEESSEKKAPLSSHTFTEGVAFIMSNVLFSQDEHNIDFGKLDDDLSKTVTVTGKNSGIQIEQHYQFYKTANVVKIHNTVRNIDREPLFIKHISSAFIKMTDKGVLDWDDERRFRLHWCKSGWGTEAQWKHGTFRDFGVSVCGIVNYDLQTPDVVDFRSEGSWSTGRYYPLVVVEDLERGVVMFAEHEGGVTWEINIGNESGGVTIEVNNADINHDGWHKVLAENDSFTTTDVVCGYLKGGFEDAIRELTKYKREVNQAKWPNNTALLCYNVYMGGLFGEPNGRNLPALIEAVGKAGCEVFCIDAGWYRPEKDPTMLNYCGDYVPDANRFDEYGLDGILKLIKDNGMIPGLWFEFEAVNHNMVGARGGDAMLKRYGKVISSHRGFYDMNDEAVREHLFNAVDRVYQMGMRYIKNDYNYSTGIGIGDNAELFNDEARRQDAAMHSFITELKRRYPDLYIENCGSGAMRSDNGTLSLFHVQSTSDQEKYYHYPSIASGSAAIMPPEKAGNWTYPYALTKKEFSDLEESGDIGTVFDRCLDGEETIFNMVTGMTGAMYMSGRFDYADEKNMALICEGTELYKKQLREFISGAYAIYPTGMGTMSKHEFETFGLINEDSSEILLAVWKIFMAEDDSIAVDLSKYIGEGAEAELIYPHDFGGCRYSWAENTRVLTVRLTGNKHMARLFRIKLK